MSVKTSSPEDYKQVVDTLRAAKRVVVVSHYNPDADAYGATGALTLALRSLGKEVVAVNESGSIERYASLPIVSEVVSNFPAGEWDCLCIVDCGDEKRVGDTLIEGIKRFPYSVSVDHHFSNTRFAKVNWVEETESSTSQMLYKLMEPLKVKISQPIAHALLAGILGDTGFFRYRSTTSETLEIASKLMSAGAVPADIGEALYFNTPVTAVRFQGRAISEVRLSNSNHVAWIVVTRKLLEEYGAQLEDADVLVDRARDIAGVRMAVVIREAEGIWRISLRSKLDKDDVSIVARSFGGGGHKMAAAFRWKGSLEALKPELEKRVGEILSG